MPYADHVDGRYRGTTDEIIQWAAAKWGFPARVLRAVAVIESWWRMDTVGDNGDSFGLFQVRRPFHCSASARSPGATPPSTPTTTAASCAPTSTARWTGSTRSSGARHYDEGDLWGPVGAWFTGRWWTPPAADYIHEVRKRMRERTWTKPIFRGRLQSDAAEPPPHPGP